MTLRSILLAFALAACASAPSEPTAPVATHHQHLISPAMSEVWTQPAFDAAALIAQLDAAGIRRGAVLSVAYVYGDERRSFADEVERVRAENDWTAAQVARYPDRLVGFCAVAPLRPYAIDEINRCSRLPRMVGLKLHLGNSGISLRNPEHAARVAAVFRAANAHRMAIVVHMRARGGTPYGREDAEAFLNTVLPAAPDSVVQIAHMAGAGPGFPPYADEALGVFVEAIAANDPRVRNVYVDVTTVAASNTTPENGALIAQRLRQIGLRRVLFSADLSIGGNPPPGEGWAIFREKVPLTPAEFATIMRNTAPYMR